MNFRFNKHADYPNIEKRRHERFSVALASKLIIDHLEYTGIIRDISLSGAFIASNVPDLPISYLGRTGQIKMELQQNWTELRCEIIYLASAKDDLLPGGAGIAFCMENQHDALAIWNLAMLFMSEGANLF